MTPNFAVVAIETPAWHLPRLWIPLFLLWIPAILLSPLIFLVLFALSVAGQINPWRTFRVLWGLLCSLPGTHVRVTADGTHVRDGLRDLLFAALETRFPDAVFEIRANWCEIRGDRNAS